MFLEGGNKTPLGGKIVVSDIYPDGAIDRSGKLPVFKYFVIISCFLNFY